MGSNSWVGLALLLTMVNAFAGDYQWFEREWVIDHDATVAMNPRYEDVAEETTRKLFSHLRWSVKDGTYSLTNAQFDTRQGPFAYSVTPISEDSFELHDPANNGYVPPIVTLTADGFCIESKVGWYRHEGRWREPDPNYVHIDCYHALDVD